jgi:antitoxin HicB
MDRHAFPIVTARDDNGTLLVTCPDLPEMTTFGEDDADAILRAADAIEEAIAARIARREDIPDASAARGRVVVHLPSRTAMKIALYNAMREAGVRKADLARKLKVHGPQVDRLLDLRHTSRIDQIEAAFAALDKRLVFDVRDAA